MEKVFKETLTVGEIVTKFPKASDVFKSYRIDFCCGGNKTVNEASLEKNVSTEEVLATLNTLYNDTNTIDEAETDWNQVPYSQLIDHVVNKHHRYLNEELPQLSPYVTKVLRVHGAGHPELSKVHHLFNALKTELEQHLIKEETEAFPMILQFENNPTSENLVKLKKIVDELENEHDQAGDIIKELREITSDFTLPVDACRTYQLVYNRLEELESDLFQHIHLENNILFPRAAAEEVV